MKSWIGVLEDINDLLGHPGLNLLKLNFIKEFLLLVPNFHLGACFVGIATTAGGYQVVAIARTGFKAWNNVVKACCICLAVGTFVIPGFVDGLAITFFC